MKEQTTQHNKENNFYKELVEVFGNRLTKATKEDDYTNGIDCYIDNKPYDFKATKGSTLTIFKFNPTGKPNKWYSPLTLHPDIPYLLPTETKGKYRVYTKASIMYFLRTNPKLSEYNGDGNINITVDISDLEPNYYLEGKIEIGVKNGSVEQWCNKVASIKIKTNEEKSAEIEQLIAMASLMSRDVSK